jgi:hypothetical protein
MEETKHIPVELHEIKEEQVNLLDREITGSFGHSIL